jgi:hypothetical protein
MSRFNITHLLESGCRIEASIEHQHNTLRQRAMFVGADNGVIAHHSGYAAFSEQTIAREIAEFPEAFEKVAGIQAPGPLFPSDFYALKCPAAPPHWPNAVIWGIAAGTPDEPRVVPLASPQPLTERLLREIEPCTPREVFRIAATCVKADCRHWQAGQDGAEGDGDCSLVQRVVEAFPELALQPCSIRSVCRWFAQEGAAACRACPGVVTDVGELPQAAESEFEVAFL